jgi:hypothetical protein
VDMWSFTPAQRSAIEILESERKDLRVKALEDLVVERILWSVGLVGAFGAGLSVGHHGWFGVIFAALIVAGVLVYAAVSSWIERKKTERFMKDFKAATSTTPSNDQPPAGHM